MLIIYGPTGVGKSDFALAIAKHTPAEIINMDVGQLYTPLSIGTAKPQWHSAPMPHHMFDILNEPLNYTVVEYRKAISTLVNDIRKRGALPILVGGSGFYIKSLFFPMLNPPSTGDHYKVPQAPSLWDALYMIDPERAQRIQPHDTYRIQRALDVWKATGTKPSLYTPQYDNIFGHHAIVYLTRDKEDLYARINERVLQMFQEGWINEVQELLNTEWASFIETKKLIGYNEILAFIQAGRPHDAYPLLIQKIQTRTRNYARRQAIFWRMLEKKITDMRSPLARVSTINLTSSSHDIYLKQLLNEATTLEQGRCYE